ncbi:MAG: Coenzyme F420 hydrogenase/dehydrogenase, beta subunit C-terminal domain [Bacillota bacterium]|nr:Coenzyme F420 hydrogenase/dehydrogenase, beta subunit C-terminal domain [Bacillota bacterium]
MNISHPSSHPCSGCGACSSICPVDAIQLQLNTAGFFEAQVDENRCVNCSLCTKVCTRYEEELSGISLYDGQLFALQSKEEKVVKSCSSGGIAHEIAKQALLQNKKVVGAVYNVETNRVEHRIIDCIDDLSLLDGSKYLQSSPQIAFQEMVKTKEEYVVFGTPCQIAGMVKVCEEKGIRDRYLFVEIFCHGIPSYQLWDLQLEKIEKKLHTNRFDSVIFRYKKDDWHSYCLQVKAKNKVYYGLREREVFWQGFFENILLNDSCFSCRYRKEISSADIRLGDYWGSRFQKRSDGISAVFALTDKGKACIPKLDLISLEAGSPEEMLKAQNMKGYSQHELHENAMDILRKQGIVASMKYISSHLSKKQKIKRSLLWLSSYIPSGIRANLKKAYSSFLLNRNRG